MKKKSGGKSSENIAVIVTVLNEANTITALLTGLLHQTLSAKEIIVVDAGSQDNTVGKMQDFGRKHPNFPLEIYIHKGTRSAGRNFAIERSSTDWIAITDAGCIPEETWLEKLFKKQAETGAAVVAGYYKGKADTPLEEAVIPYALVMPDKIGDEFLPATRSMLIKKELWQQAGKFPEKLNYSEDFFFARKLKKMGVEMAFAHDAVVAWQPRSNLKDFYKMIYRFARGDVIAGIFRPKVGLVFFRYVLGISLFLLAVILQVPELLMLLVVGFILYVIWAIKKNITYVPNGWYWLPILQFTADVAVMGGTISGVLYNKQLV